MEGPEFDLSAASLRADGTELSSAVEVLAVKLESALPGSTTVRRRARRLLSRDRLVHEIEVSLPASRFRLVVAEHGVECFRQKIVGGISISRESLALGEWLRALTGELDVSSEQTARARVELERLLD